MARIIIDKAKELAVNEAVKKAEAKDKAPPLAASEHLSIDNILRKGLESLDKMMDIVHAESQNPSRETVQNLKDLMSILKELKKEEREFLDSLSDDALEKLDAGNKKRS